MRHKRLEHSNKMVIHFINININIYFFGFKFKMVIFIFLSSVLKFLDLSIDLFLLYCAIGDQKLIVVLRGSYFFIIV